MHHRLRKIYENMLSEGQTEKKSKSLKEVYGKILTERYALYAKEVSADEPAPDYNDLGLEILGDVENPEKIKYAIVSYSLLKPLESLLQKADEAGSGWHKPPVVGIKLAEMGQEFVALGISNAVVSGILANKDSLTDLEEQIKSSNEFNLREVVVGNLKKINLPVEDEKLYKLYDYLYPLTANIALASVGAGEIAASILTNAKKGIKGDLVFGNQKVEIKGLGGRVGKADYAWKNTAKGLASYLSNVKSTSVGKETAKTLQYKKSIREAYNKIINQEILSKHINKDYTSLINSFLKTRDLVALEKIVTDSGILTTNSKEFLSKYLVDSDPNFPLKPIPPPKSAIEFFNLQNRTIKKYLINLMNLAEFERDENVLDPNNLASQNYASAVRRFFLNDIGLTAQQAADAFTRHARTGYISENEAVSIFGSYIADFFASNYEAMKDGNERLLEALIFGYSLAIYAKKDGFNYFFMVNDSTQESIAINTSVGSGEILLDAAQKFLSNDKFSLSLRADERGGSGISFGSRKTIGEE